MIIGLHDRTANYARVALCVINCRRKGYRQPMKRWIRALNEGKVPAWAPQELWNECR